MIELKRANISDLEAIVNLHMQIFDDYFLTNLGSEILRKYYYVYFSTNDFQVVAKEKDEIVGFAIVTVNFEERMSEFYHTNMLALLITLIKKLCFFNSTIISGFIPRIQNVLKKEKSLFIEDSITLLSIAVAPNYQKKGIAKSMIQHIEMELDKQDIESYGLSVKVENEQAIKSYEKLGFVKVYEKKDLLYYRKYLKGNENNE